MELYERSYTNDEISKKFTLATVNFPEKKRVEKLQRMYFDFATVVDVMLPTGKDKEEAITQLSRSYNSVCNSILNNEMAKIPGGGGL